MKALTLLKGRLNVTISVGKLQSLKRVRYKNYNNKKKEFEFISAELPDYQIHVLAGAASSTAVPK